MDLHARYLQNVFARVVSIYKIINVQYFVLLYLKLELTYHKT